MPKPPPLSAEERAKRQLLADRAFNLKGYQGAQEAEQKFDRERRKKAQEGASVILSPDDVKGDYDASRLLYTTLGGKKRPITAQDLEVFRKNAETVKKILKEKYKGGITPQQVIDLSLDIDRQRSNEQIHYALINRHTAEGLFHYVTNASAESTSSRHHVDVQFMNWGAAVASPKDVLTITKSSLVKGHVKFDCDCGRHTFWYRYLATIGNYYVGRRETGYPDERNANLVGVACKHVLRVMAVILQPSSVLQLSQKLQKARDDSALNKKKVTPNDMREELARQSAAEHFKKSSVRTSAEKAYKKAAKETASRPTKRQKELAEMLAKAQNLTPPERKRAITAVENQIQSSKDLHELGIRTKAEHDADMARYNDTLEALKQAIKQGA